jgi:integrase
MPKSLPRYVDKFRDRLGRIRLYFRRKPGPRIPLPLDPYSREFATAYANALANGAKAMPATESATDQKTIAWLIDYYQKTSSAYKALRPSTRHNYDLRFKLIEADNGQRPLAGLNPDRVEHLLSKLDDKPGAKRDTLKKLRIIFNYAMAKSIDGKSIMTSDPTRGIVRPKSKSIRSWRESEIAAYESRWPIGTMERLAFDLFLYTGQRISDVHKMRWNDIEDGSLRVTQKKTMAQLEIAIHPALAQELAATKRVQLTILTTSFGLPFKTAKSFGNFMRDAITAAGLPMDAQPHGLRKSTGRRLAEAGASANQIMAVLGHKTLAEAQKYVQDANQKRLGKSAVALLDDHRAQAKG